MDTFGKVDVDEKLGDHSAGIPGATAPASYAFLEAQARASEFERSPALKSTLKRAFRRVQPGLELVQARMTSCFKADAPELIEISNYLLELGGKRIRPVLALLSSELFAEESTSPQLIDAAAGIELIHMATLLHDDIIDESPLRRNKESAPVKFGLAASLLAGDFLWVRAFGLCAHLGEFIVRSTESACVELTEGEVTEGYLTGSRKISLDEYIEIISKKTGALFWLAAAVGSYLGQANKRNIELLSKFGRSAGIVFQMVDDILDVVADETLLGKKSGTDLRQRTPSLINLLWLQSGDQAAKDYFFAESVTEAQVEAALQHVRRSNIVAEARDYATQYSKIALASLNDIQQDSLREVVRAELSALIEFTLDRCL